MTYFYDSARWGLIPVGSSACLYGDGRYVATPQDAKHFARVRWITVFGNPGCGCADYEQFNPVHDIPGKLREWAEGRKAGGWRARCYCDRSDLPKAHSLIGDLPNVRWWIATLDNGPRGDGVPWTAEELLANIAANEGVHLAPGTLWANQFKGGPSAPYDESVLFPGQAW